MSVNIISSRPLLFIFIAWLCWNGILCDLIAQRQQRYQRLKKLKMESFYRNLFKTIIKSIKFEFKEKLILLRAV